MSDDPATRVAVAVVSWNTLELLRRCVASLEADHDAGLASVWVVDNGSSDGSAEMVKDEFGWATLVTPGENLGFGRAVNLVAERSRERWIAPANADIEFRPGALAALLQAGERDPQAGSIAPRLEMADGATQHSVHRFPTPALGLMVGLGLYRIVPGLGDRLCIDAFWDPSRPRRVDWAHGALLVCRREAFEQVGGFDAAQWMYAEDIDLAWRMRKAGWTTIYVPDAMIRHEVSAATAKAFGDERDARHLDAAYRWMERRQGRLAARVYAIENVLGSMARVVALTVASALSRKRFAGRRDRAHRNLALHRAAMRRA